MTKYIPLLCLVAALSLSATYTTAQQTNRTTSYTYDMGVSSQNTAYLVAKGSTNTFTGVAHNYGTTAITAMNLNYSVNGGPAITNVLTSLSVASGADYNFSHSIPWVPALAGTYVVRFWCDNLNIGNNDQNTVNDTLTATFTVVDTIVNKQVLVELFTQASCGYCLMMGPHVDTAIQKATQQHICNAVRYHVYWPGTDYMNQVTQWTFIGQRISYYNDIMVPNCWVDGVDDNDIYVLELNYIKAAQPVGSPFKITIDTFRLDAPSNTYHAHVTIKSYGYFGAGLMARAVLTVDTIKYAQDQSTETPISGFAPPIGTGTYGDSLYPDVFNFPYVSEDMMPSASGTYLNSFVPESSQSFSLSWKKDHPWGASPATYAYDSLFPGVHLTVFVQTDAALPGIAAHYVFQSAADSAHGVVNTSVNELGNNVGSVKVYPNPNHGIFNLTIRNYQLGMKTEVEVYNMLGEKVYSQLFLIPNSQFLINMGTQPAGIYMYRVVSESGVQVGEGKFVVE